MRAFWFCIVAAQAFGGEYAILSNGFRVYADRHETIGGMIRLHTKDGVTDLPAASVTSFEVEEYVAPPPAPAQPPAPTVAATPSQPLSIREMVDRAAERASLPKAIVHSVAKNESAYRPDAISPKGAIGVMQLMPGTAASLSADPRDPKQNVEAGAMYLRELLIKYDGDVAKALAAYNAGPGAVDKYNGVPPYKETRSYVNRVIRDYKKQTGETN